ncbi:MAG: hypothetical protein F4W68_03665 [Cenarchaeum sp. SB0661_bin_35]|nr:hypothetical protein [Cenarchaeum sp. SB0667_bin_13]MXZ92983.1 hypothetical protein [Cenarchaeum sp. SB0666_bin_15]MYB47484.1 hypothetical protein [Cenarchaeum sp. SB0662_bin_33]MYC79583.1 hypothetical protein [Cenarchaeum sp. SB0661_bin_35]MYI52161.1 hypothetical protein [Cenarchaeum sp. SB0673_bin_9]MYJ27374.1 hypothetical protein [Cenarchaeum sp. SB0672_bin_9]
MKEFLRTTRQGRWYIYPEVDWLDEYELQSDTLSDIMTKNGRLSVFSVSNHADKQRVAVALAANRENITNMDYAVFDESCLRPLGITVQQTKGETPDEYANKLHYELGDLTVERLALLTKIAYTGKHERIRQKHIKELLSEAARSRQLDENRIKHEKMWKCLPWGARE